MRPVLTPGPVLFARYAYPPNALGYCGPDDHGALFEAAASGRERALLRHLAAGFEGAWPYLELIAAANGIADPLERRVVEAYWIGNALSVRVPAAALIASLAQRFDRRAGSSFASIASSVLLGGIPQHSFHVFSVYPWLGMLRAGKSGTPLIVLDRCRIRWGVVEAVEADVAVVRSRVLTFAGSRLVLGNEVTERARYGLTGALFDAPLAPGEVVSLHWDWICDRLDCAGVRALERSTRLNLRAVNALAAPGPAVVVDAGG